MAIHFHKKFISIVAAVSILITGIGASQAQADNDTEKAIAALLGLAIIGAVIADDAKHDRRKKKAHKTHRHHDTRPKHIQRDDTYHRVKPRPLPKNARRALLPQDCLREFRSRKGSQRLYVAKCMNRTYANVNRLPRSCERQVRTDRGWRQGWGALCLHKKGYRMARR